jgi:hypothetical protein
MSAVPNVDKPALSVDEARSGVETRNHHILRSPKRRNHYILCFVT